MPSPRADRNPGPAGVQLALPWLFLLVIGIAGCSDEPGEEGKPWYVEQKADGQKSAADAVLHDSSEAGSALVRVIDGDTLVARQLDGSEATVRLIGIDAPELARAGKAEDCGGNTAKQALVDLLSAGQVVLSADPSQGELDKYGRLLRYVGTASLPDLALELLGRGLVEEYTYKENAPYQRQTGYRQAEAEAKVSEKGIWGSCPPSAKP